MSVALVALVATFFQISPVWIILAAAIIGYTLMTSDANALKLPQPRPRDGSNQKRSVLALAFGIPGKLTSLIAAFLKVGVAFFGGGFVLIPLLRAKLVTDLHWITPQEFLDGLAISTLTPGPIAVIATFVGYHKAGIAGALVATISLLAPGIVLTIWASEGYCRFRSSPALKRVLSGLHPATAGLILGAAILLGKHSVSGWRGALLIAVALLLLRRFRWHPALVLALGGTGGYLGVIR